MKIELLYFDGCTAYKTALKHLKDVIGERKLDATIEMIKIADEQQAVASRFLGSPSIRVNGRDIEPGAEKINDFSMRCRLYIEDDAVSEWPSKNMIRRAIDSLI